MASNNLNFSLHYAYYHDLLNRLLMHRWNYHGRPPGGDVSYISDTGNLRPGTLFTVRYAKHVLFRSRGEVPFQSTL